MNVNFRKIARGPAWERWLIIENQHGDAGFAGEITVTYADTTGYSDVDCDVFVERELAENEIEELLQAVTSILSGQGNVRLFTIHQLVCKGFSLLEDEGFDDSEENKN